eukprot:1664532-Prymnesium_polylepis.1
MQTFQRKCAQIDARYPGMSEKDIVRKLLGRAPTEIAADSDDDGGDGATSSSSIGVTGTQGGRLLVCFLVRAVRSDSVPKFLNDGVAAFLRLQVPKVALFPGAKLCIEEGIKFLPKLEAAL